MTPSKLITVSILTGLMTVPTAHARFFNNYEQSQLAVEAEWLRNKEANCENDAAIVERLLSQRDHGGSIVEVLLASNEDRYYINIAASHWNDRATARETSGNLYRYCLEKGTYWSPLIPIEAEEAE